MEVENRAFVVRKVRKNGRVTLPTYFVGKHVLAIEVTLTEKVVFFSRLRAHSIIQRIMNTWKGNNTK